MDGITPANQRYRGGMKRFSKSQVVGAGKAIIGRHPGATPGCCQVNRAKSKAPLPCLKSRNGRRPSRVSLGPKTAKNGSADQMPLDVEGVVDRRVGGEKSLG